jgi:hypothetical protein
MALVKLPKFSEIPAKPVGLTTLFRMAPGGDRGLTFARGKPKGVPLGKVPGYWTCPYNGTITAVYLNTDIGGYTVKFWKSSFGRSPILDDNISIAGYTINPPQTHQEFFDLSDFLEVDVIVGDTFAVEIVTVTDPPPTDIAGNVVVIKTEEET